MDKRVSDEQLQRYKRFAVPPVEANALARDLLDARAEIAQLKAQIADRDDAITRISLEMQRIKETLAAAEANLDLYQRPPRDASKCDYCGCPIVEHFKGKCYSDGCTPCICQLDEDRKDLRAQLAAAEATIERVKALKPHLDMFQRSVYLVEHIHKDLSDTGE